MLFSLSLSQAPTEDLDLAESGSHFGVADDLSSQDHPVTQGLNQALIEDYYPGEGAAQTSR
jgi:hypothetical protein